MMCGMAEQPGVVEVSRREAEVLAAVGAHLSNAEIARSLFISVRTVESHVSALLRKYGVADRRALAALAAPAQEGAEPGHHTGIELGRISGLPTFRTTLVGRAAERAAVVAALESAALVTVLGPGGVGKTRLVTAVAADAASAFPLGGAFVDLVPATEEYVTQAVAAALGVTERLKQPLEDVLHDRLRRGRTLLVLDNCEHLVDAAAGFVERVLAACPATVVLVTSRERLGVPGERVVPLDPLPVAGEAQELFRQRAADVDPGFVADHDTVAEICARLDGMPLAIELAAARSASLGPDGLLAGLDDAVRLLSTGRRPDRRHGSLRAVVDWSYRLLDDDERAMFRGLAVFAGSFDVAAVVAVVAPGVPPPVVADLMGRLVDKSLVVRGDRGWRLLAPLRAFAAEQLGTGDESAAARLRHLNWAADTAESLERGLPGTVESVDAVLDDLRAALDGLGAAGDVDVPHRLARSLARLCFARRFLVEALAHYRHAAELAPSAEARAADLVAAAGCAHVATASGLAYELLQAAVEESPPGNAAASTTARLVEVAHRFHTFYDTVLDDGRIDALLDGALAMADPGDPVVAARLAIAAAWRAGPASMTADRAKAANALAAARACGDPLLVSAALDALSSAALHDGEVRAAHRITLDRLALLPGLDRTDPASAPEIEDAYYVATTTSMAAGDLRAALQIGRDAQADELVGRHPFIAASDLAAPLLLAGGPAELDEGFALVEAMWEQWELAGRPAAIWMVPALAAAALAAGLRGETASRDRWRARVDEIGRVGAVGPRDGDPFVAFVDARLALWEPALWDLGRADPEQLVERAFRPFRHSRFWPYAHAAGAELAVVAGLADAAERVAAAREAAAENDWAATCLNRATGRLTGDPALLVAAVAGWERVGSRWERAETLLLLPDRAEEGRAELTELRRGVG